MDSIERIVTLYNYDFQYYEDFKYVLPENVQTYGFEECNCADKYYLNDYFNQKRFFDGLKLMPNAYSTLRKLAIKNDITIVSSGYIPNLRAKEVYIKKYLPFCEFIGVDLNKYLDKSHIDMCGGIIIDDSAQNLKTSNAKYKLCFGKIYPWNAEWVYKGAWMDNWDEVREYIEKEIN